MSPKVPRDVSGKALCKVLSKYGYEILRQSGSHIRMSVNNENGGGNITIPNHDSIRLGILMSIISEVADQLKIAKEEIISKL